MQEVLVKVRKPESIRSVVTLNCASASFSQVLRTRKLRASLQNRRSLSEAIADSTRCAESLKFYLITVIYFSLVRAL